MKFALDFLAHSQKSSPNSLHGIFPPKKPRMQSVENKGLLVGGFNPSQKY